MRALLATAALAVTLLISPAHRVQAAEGASFDDTAKFLAGMQPSADSPLTPLTRENNWKAHARHFDEQWKSVDARQLSRVRAWVGGNLSDTSGTLFYMFSGPDVLYATTFFPNASTYVLSGLEYTGPIPDLSKIRGPALSAALDHIKTSLRQVLSHGYFITSQMGAHLSRGQLPGTIPVMYLFLARTGKTIKDVSFVQLEPNGTVKVLDASTPPGSARAVRITFTSGSGEHEQTLYYFSTDLGDGGVAKSGFLKFCDQLKPGNSFIKSASYLMHGRGFSSVRNFVLENSKVIVQDDTGVPARMFIEDTWSVQPFGRYTRPIPVFSGMYQPQMTRLFNREKPAPLDFSIGYRWGTNQSHLLLATRRVKSATRP
jgi:hypothetical protein